jgi:hypothetical protein
MDRRVQRRMAQRRSATWAIVRQPQTRFSVGYRLHRAERRAGRDHLLGAPGGTGRGRHHTRSTRRHSLGARAWRAPDRTPALDTQRGIAARRATNWLGWGRRSARIGSARRWLARHASLLAPRDRLDIGIGRESSPSRSFTPKWWLCVHVRRSRAAIEGVGVISAHPTSTHRYRSTSSDDRLGGPAALDQMYDGFAQLIARADTRERERFRQERRRGPHPSGNSNKCSPTTHPNIAGSKPIAGVR